LLWYLSGSITLPIGDFEITIPGYMFWVAVLYSGLGSVIAHLIGRPLIRLYNRQQAVEPISPSASSISARKPRASPSTAEKHRSATSHSDGFAPSTTISSASSCAAT